MLQVLGPMSRKQGLHVSMATVGCKASRKASSEEKRCPPVSSTTLAWEIDASRAMQLLELG